MNINLINSWGHPVSEYFFNFFGHNNRDMKFSYRYIPTCLEHLNSAECVQT